jgi:poly(3-hydroxybutyrate) depolymerase
MSLRSPQSLPVLASASSLRALEPGTSTTLGLRVNGQERVFLVHIPKGYDGRREVPLVLLYNGITDTPLGFEQYSQS